METEEQQGQQAPVSQQMPDRYADYLEDNADPVDAGTSDEPAVEPQDDSVAVKTPEARKPQEQKPNAGDAKKEGQKPSQQDEPAYVRKIRRQRAQIGALEDRVRQLEAEKAKPAPKYSRDHFVSDEEYEDWREQQRTNRIRTDIAIENAQEQIQNLSSEADETEFRESWNTKLSDNFEGDPEGLKHYVQTLRGLPANYLRPEIHEMIRSSGVGPRMLQVLGTYPHMAKELNAIKSPVVLGARLAKLESQVEYHLQRTRAQGQQAPAPAARQPQGPKAPPPIGPVGGNHGSQEVDEEALYDQVRNKKFGVRR